MSRLRVRYWEEVEQTDRIVEIPGSNRLLYGGDVRRIRIAFDHDFNSFAQASQLVTNVSCSTQTLELQELLIAELLGIIRLGPSLPNVEKSEVISTTHDEILPGLVGVKLFVLRTIEEGSRF